MNRKLLVGASAAAAVFALGVAIWTQNPGLYLLAAVAAGTAFTAWSRSGPR